MDEVQLVHANPTHAQVKKPDGRETSVFLRNKLDVRLKKLVINRMKMLMIKRARKKTGDEEHEKDNEQKDEEEEHLQPTLRRLSRIKKRTEILGYVKL